MLDIKENVSLKNYTTFRIGGPAKFFVEAKNDEELIEALKYAKNNNLDFFILGGGSNLLVSDNGFDGLVIKIKLDNIEIKKDKKEIIIGAGVQLAKAVNEAAKNGLAGLEWAAGIPGTVGGAIRGNAGSMYGGEMKDIVAGVSVLDVKKVETKEMDCVDCTFSYRYSFFKLNPDIVILSARLKMTSSDPMKLKERIKEIITERAGKHPHGMGSAGSFFLNPVVKKAELISEFELESGKASRGGKVPSGWIIERAGLKGKKIGGAMVSEKHANFIVNTGGATAQDVIMLASFVKQQVRDKFGIELQEEVQYVGF